MKAIDTRYAGGKEITLIREIKIRCKEHDGKSTWFIDLYVNGDVDELYVRYSPEDVGEVVTALCQCKELPWYCKSEV